MKRLNCERFTACLWLTLQSFNRRLFGAALILAERVKRVEAMLHCAELLHISTGLDAIGSDIFIDD
jgi:hypothetical protein